MSFLTELIHKKEQQKKGVGVLLDPDKIEPESFAKRIQETEKRGIDCWLVGGSLLFQGNFELTITVLKEYSSLPVLIFPGNNLQVSSRADGLLFLSLLSGRNPDFLIGQHVIAAPLIRQTNLEVIPTAYLLIDSGSITTAHYMSHTLPIPHNKPEIAACTALAGQYLGFQVTYLDGGSGARQPVSPEMIAAVREYVKTPIFVGGGIKNKQQIHNLWNAGADIVVIGTAIENGDFKDWW